MLHLRWVFQYKLLELNLNTLPSNNRKEIQIKVLGTRDSRGRITKTVQYCILLSKTLSKVSQPLCVLVAS